MIKTAPLNCFLTSFVVERKPAASRNGSTICCSVSRRNDNIPKLEPFSRSWIERAIKDPPLIEKTENQIADYCVTLEGDDSYSCWRAYFELKELEKEVPKKDIERVIIQAGGIKSLISFIHSIASIFKAKKEQHDSVKHTELHEAKKEQHDSVKHTKLENAVDRQCPIPDGLPKTPEELKEEEEARMPDSPFTRLLRAKGRSPAWYSPPPDHGMY